MNAKDEALYVILANELAEINKSIIPLPGINNSGFRDSFIKQMIDSIRRVNYVYVLREREISENRCDPSSEQFDPIRAAILKYRSNDIDEAVWLIFLSTHFGKNLKSGWLRTRDFYGGLGNSNTWTWEMVCTSMPEFVEWFGNNYHFIRGAFGNHRKYESLRPDAQKNLVAVISSYITWVGENHSHSELIMDVDTRCGSDPKQMFSCLYKKLSDVLSFGRTARFDFLTMLGKTGIVNIVPDSPYLDGATGPLTGAKLLLSGSGTARMKVAALEDVLGILNSNLTIGDMGMQVLEDSLCNWQKNPAAFRRFRG